MALSPAIAATSQAILGLVQSASLGGEFQSATFAHYQASNFQSPMTEGVSLWLYRLTVNANRNQPPRVGRDGRRYRPPLPLDLHYLVTAWAGDAVKQQRLLGFAIRTLEDTPILPAGVLNQHGPEPEGEAQAEDECDRQGGSGKMRDTRGERTRKTQLPAGKGGERL